jgi:homoserine dehydrogenase
MKNIKVGVVGYGTVGKGTIQILKDNADIIKKNCGFNIEVKAIADRNIDKKIDAYVANIPVRVKDPYVLLNDKEIDVIVELIGGLSDAKKIVLDAIKRGKHVVTANKSLLAAYGYDIFREAENSNVLLGFEASVGGGIPIIRVLKEDMCINDIRQIYAIVNGTANYILTRMESDNKEFNEVLIDAQRQGYAEADPSFDVDGIDSAHKIAIIASLAFGTLIPFKCVYYEGISNIKRLDIDMAAELNGKIKLLAIAKKNDRDIEVRVHPTIIPNRYFLADVEDVYNAIYIRTSKIDRTMHYGRGAGGLPTGSAVISDIVSIGKDINSCCKRRVPVIGFEKPYGKGQVVKDINDVVTPFYLRLTVNDRPNVLSKIAGILGEHGISILSAIQRAEWLKNDVISLILMTHQTAGRNIFNAVGEIDCLDIVKDKTLIIRVEK